MIDVIVADGHHLVRQGILVDPGLSRPGGLETIPRLRSMLPETSIIVLSLDDSTAYCQAMLSVGADDCVCKAALVTDLLPSIRQATQAHRLREPAKLVPHPGTRQRGRPSPARSRLQPAMMEMGRAVAESFDPPWG